MCYNNVAPSVHNIPTIMYHLLCYHYYYRQSSSAIVHESRGVRPTNILSSREAARLPLTGSRSRTSRGRTAIRSMPQQLPRCSLLGISERWHGKTAWAESYKVGSAEWSRELYSVRRQQKRVVVLNEGEGESDRASEGASERRCASEKQKETTKTENTVIADLVTGVT